MAAPLVTRERTPCELGAVLSPLAQRLEARARLSGRTAAALDASFARVLFAAWELDPAARHAFESERELWLVAPDGERTRELPERPQALLWELAGPAAALARLASASPAWQALDAAHRHAVTPPAAPALMGIVNVTPDSFSDGGEFLAPEAAVAHALELDDAGADWIDVGGESTRPGAEPVEEPEELRRVLPVIEALAGRTSAGISVDTQKSAVARAALDAGATLVNDVSAGTFDPRMLELAAERGARLVLMHRRGDPRTMQSDTRYGDVVREVIAFLRERAACACNAGVEPARIVLDPGIGFGKRLADNLALVRAVPELRSLGCPILLGVSRKAFLGALTGASWQAEKLPETSAAVAAGILFGAEILRVHDVRRMRPLVRVAAALAGVAPAAATPDPR